MDPHTFQNYYPTLPTLPPAMRPFPFPATSSGSPSNRGMIFYPQPLPMTDNTQRESPVESDRYGLGLVTRRRVYRDRKSNAQKYEASQ